MTSQFLRKAPLSTLLTVLLLISSFPASLAQADPAPVTSGAWQCWNSNQVNPCRHHLADVALLPTGEGWAVGGMPGHGTIFHWVEHDGAWQEAPNPASTGLAAVDALSPADAWAVSDLGDMLHWDGQAWTQQRPFTTLRLTAVSMVASDDVWAVGYVFWQRYWALMAHWDGSAWTDITVAGVNQRLSAVDMPVSYTHLTLPTSDLV
mgnify:FL=1